MSHQYTNEQQKAISSINTSTVVVAGAGSGKTRVLVGRYLEILKKRMADISEIVAITFTNKAAAEMNERIRKNLEEELNRCDPTEKQYYESLMSRQSETIICTIDALCKRLVGEYPLEAGVSPAFETMDNLDVMRRKKSAGRLAVEHSLEDGDGITQLLIEKISFKSLVSGLTFLYEDIRITGTSIEDMSVSDMGNFDITPYIGNDNNKLPHDIVSAHLVKLIKSMHKEYVKLGANGSRLDFVELELAFLRLLNDSKIGDKIRREFKYVMVDEYQDINDIQDAIIKLLTQDDYSRKLFIVGDPKQSIYRFRGGNLQLFNKRAKEIAKFSDGIINLDVNFRSKSTIIDTTNHIFSRLFGEEFVYSKAGRAKEPSETPCELMIISSDKTAEDAFYDESTYISEQIQKFVQSADLKISYRDIAILMRSMSNVDTLIKAFEKHRIPYEVTNNSGLYSTPEIALMLNLLISITDESDDLALASVLRSVLFNLDDADIINIKWNRPRNSSLYSSLMDYDTSQKNGDKIAYAQEILSRLSSEVDMSDAFSMIMKIADETEIEAKLALYPDGAKKLSNLKKFFAIVMNLARKYSIYDLVDCIKELAEGDEGEGEANLSSDAVRIMTIHKSKGLEFPIVFLPQMSKTIPSLKKFGVYDKHLGLWARVKSNFIEEDDLSLTIKNENEEKELAEHIRCLYVGMTRACDKLIMVGTEKKKDSIDGEISESSKTSWKYLVSKALDVKFDFYGEKHCDLDGNDVRMLVRVVDGNDLDADDTCELHEKEYEINDFTKEFPLLEPILKDESRKVSLPVSAIVTYVQCKRRYVYIHILKIQPDFLPKEENDSPFVIKKGLNPVEVGDVFHSVCKRLNADDDVDSVIREEASNFGSHYTEEDIQKLSVMVEKYVKYYLPEDSNKNIYKEEPFLFGLGNLNISGIIDRFRLFDSNKAIITDFKTDKVDKESIKERALSYQIQMDCYALAVASKFNPDEIVTRLHFMRPDEVYERAYSRDDIEDMKKEISSMTDGIDSVSLITAPYEESQACDKCVYSVLCGRGSMYDEIEDLN